MRIIDLTLELAGRTADPSGSSPLRGERIRQPRGDGFPLPTALPGIRLGNPDALRPHRDARGLAVPLRPRARGIKALGCDLASPDDPKDLTRPVHMILLGQGILIMEHVAQLETLPASRFQFVGVPLRIRGATGSPIRAIAIFEGEGVRP